MRPARLCRIAGQGCSHQAGSSTLRTLDAAYLTPAAGPLSPSHTSIRTAGATRRPKSFDEPLSRNDERSLGRKPPKVYGAGFFKSRFYDDPADELPSEQQMVDRIETALDTIESSRRPMENDIYELLNATVPILKSKFRHRLDSLSDRISYQLYDYFVRRKLEEVESPSIQRAVGEVLAACYVRTAKKINESTTTPVNAPSKLAGRDQVEERYALFILHQILNRPTDAGRMNNLMDDLMESFRLYKATGSGYRISPPLVAAYVVLRTKLGIDQLPTRFIWPQKQLVLNYIDDYMSDRGMSSKEFTKSLDKMYQTMPIADLPQTMDKFKKHLEELVQGGKEEKLIDLWRRVRDYLATASPHQSPPNEIFSEKARPQLLLEILQALKASRFGDNTPFRIDELEKASNELLSLVKRPLPVGFLHTLVANRARVLGSAPEPETGADVYSLDRAIAGELEMSSKELALKNLHEVWAMANQPGAERDVKLYMLYMEGLGRLGDLNGLQKVWNSMLKDDVCRRSNQRDNPEASFPPTRALNKMISATILIPITGLPVARELFEQACRPNSLVKCDIVTINTFLRHYARSGDIAGMQSLFSLAGKLKLQPDIVTYTTLVQGLLRAGQMDMAKNTLQSMHASGLRPNERMCTVLVSDLAKDGRKAGLEHAEELIREMKRWNMPIGIITWTALISGYFRGGWTQDGWDAVRRFEDAQLQDPTLQLNRVSYNVILKQAGEQVTSYNAGDVPATMRLFQKMVEDGVRPNADTYMIMLVPFLKEKLWSEADKVVNVMEKLNFVPDKAELREYLKKVKFRRHANWETPGQNRKRRDAEGEKAKREAAAKERLKKMMA